MSWRGYAGAVLAACALTLGSTAVPGSARTTYPDIMGCEEGCESVAVGFPIAYIADYPGLSPVDSADLIGALLGMDKVLWGRAAANLAIWISASLFVAYVIRLRRARDAK